MTDEELVVTVREGSSMVSTWTEYLLARPLSNGTARLEVCMYEALAHAEEYYDEDKDDYIFPENIDGKRVIGTSDEWVIGGNLGPAHDDSRFEYSLATISQAIAWVSRHGFALNDADIQKIMNSVIAGQ